LRNRTATSTALIKEGIEVWGQDIVDRKEERLKRLEAVGVAAEDLVRRTSIGLLNKIALTPTQIADAKDGMEELRWVERTKRGADAFSTDVSYLRSARDVMGDADPFEDDTEDLRKRIVGAFLDGEIEPQEITTLRAESGQFRKQYVDEAARAHSRDRLDATGDDRKRVLTSGDLFKSLDALAGVTLLPEDRLRSIKEKLAGLVGCREFDEADLARTVVCPHCAYRPKPSTGPTARARLDAVADEAKTVRAEWAATLVDAVREKETQDKVTALDAGKRAVIDRLVKDGELPETVDGTFVAAINAALERFERRNASPTDLWQTLFPTSSPATVDELRSRFDAFLRQLTDGAQGRPVRVVPTEETPE
jgi:hypothetical protein